jgi:FkbM family methyltransferase
MEHHPIFSEFKAFSGSREAGVNVDFIGFKARDAWNDYAPSPSYDEWSSDAPYLSEEYFEWVDILQAVCDARESFTMLELGAGYGRWGIRAALAAQQRRLRHRVVYVEAEPQHAAWLRDAFEMNGVSGKVIEAAISYSGEPVAFAVAGGQMKAANWYGQAVVTDAQAATGETYFGHPILRGNLYDQILVPSVRLEDVASDLGIIDMIDSDTQGAEGDMVVNSIGFLSERVRRVHIGTHSELIEAQIRDTFQAAGWRKVWDFSLQGERDTPFGDCWFGDGVSAWINPRLT